MLIGILLLCIAVHSNRLRFVHFLFLIMQEILFWRVFFSSVYNLDLPRLKSIEIGTRANSSECFSFSDFAISSNSSFTYLYSRSSWVGDSDSWSWRVWSYTHNCTREYAHAIPSDIDLPKLTTILLGRGALSGTDLILCSLRLVSMNW